MKSTYFNDDSLYQEELESAWMVAGHRVEVFDEDDRLTLWVRIAIDDDKAYSRKLLYGSGSTLQSSLQRLVIQTKVIAETVAHFKGWGSTEHERLDALAKGLNTWRWHISYTSDGLVVPDDIGPAVHTLIEEAA